MTNKATPEQLMAALGTASTASPQARTTASAASEPFLYTTPNGAYGATISHDCDDDLQLHERPIDEHVLNKIFSV